MATFPRDQFDDIPEDLHRVGAHRAPAKKGRGWFAFLWAILATVILVAGGLFALSRFDSRFALDIPLFQAEETPTPTPTPIETAEPVTDPVVWSTENPELWAALTVSVLNGTPTQGLANLAGDQLVAAGWPDPARANASERDEEATIVYYSSEDYEGVARGIAQQLGVDRGRALGGLPGRDGHGRSGCRLHPAGGLRKPFRTARNRRFSCIRVTRMFNLS